VNDEEMKKMLDIMQTYPNANTIIEQFITQKSGDAAKER